MKLNYNLMCFGNDSKKMEINSRLSGSKTSDDAAQTTCDLKKK